jgi:hypothetical protein
MANYSKFKTIPADRVDVGVITTDKLQSGFGALKTFIVANEQALCLDACAQGGANDPLYCQYNGKCCLWTVPAGAKRVTFELWGGGGGGAGHACLCCYHQEIHGSGGGYAVKTIATTEGCQYTICAGGVWPCVRSCACTAGGGCMSYVTGYNLSNFCVNGGCGGWRCTTAEAWNPCWGDTCIGTCAAGGTCGFFGADFGIMGTSGAKIGHSATQDGSTCMRHDGVIAGAAPMTGKNGMTSTIMYWQHCGCYVIWPGGGGITGTMSYCTNDFLGCAVTGTMGGSGAVRITYG